VEDHQVVLRDGLFFFVVDREHIAVEILGEFVEKSIGESFVRKDVGVEDGLTATEIDVSLLGFIEERAPILFVTICNSAEVVFFENAPIFEVPDED